VKTRQGFHMIETNVKHRERTFNPAGLRCERRR